jgi:endonuclease/exonuclease/phosphatase family metal-dependent hydrolase
MMRAEIHTAFSVNTKSHAYTYFPALDADEMHASPMRLDYMLGNPLAASMLVTPAHTLVSQHTGILSDHYPVECVLTLESLCSTAE